MADYAYQDVKWLGQTFHVGAIVSSGSHWDISIQENATSFVVYQALRDNVGFYDEHGNLKESGYMYVHDGVKCAIAFGFRKFEHYTPSYVTYGNYYCVYKLASANNVIDWQNQEECPDDTSYMNGWSIMFGSSITGYNYEGMSPSIFGHIEDLPSEQLFRHLAFNSIMFFAPIQGMYPYSCHRGIWETYNSASDVWGYADSMYHMTQGVGQLTSDNYETSGGYDGPTPMTYTVDRGWTNSVGNYLWATPNYRFSSIQGIGAVYNGLCPLDFGGVIVSDTPIEPDPRPSGGGGFTGTIGGWDSTTKKNKTKPGKDVQSTGLVSIFAPTDQELNELAHYLWTDDYYDSSVKWGLKPMDSIITFGVVPFDVTTESLSTNLHLCGQEVRLNGSPIQMFKVKDQWNLFEMGSVYVQGHNYDNIAAFSDYDRTKVIMYIPCIGFVNLVATDVLGKWVTLQYWVDVFSGQIIAEVYCNKHKNESDNGYDLRYTFTGNCFTNFPLTEANYAQYYQQKAKTGLNMVGDIVGNITSAITNPLNAPGAVVDTISSIFDGVNNLTSLAPEVARSGSIENALAIMNYEQPFIITVSPQPYFGTNFIKYYGYNTMSNYKINNLPKGFTQIARVNDNTVKATDTEKQMIESILKDGFFLNYHKTS